jgi:hypothetical protein
LIAGMVFGEEYRAYSSLLRSLLHSPVTWSSHTVSAQNHLQF